MKKIITLMLMGLFILTLVGCGETNSTYDVSEIVKEYNSGLRACDYIDSASFETALNNGENVLGKMVRFDVLEYKPDSGLGINCWSGEHLNFISDHELAVDSGDYIVAFISSEPKKTLGSWKVPYDVVEIIKKEIEIASESSTESDSDLTAPLDSNESIVKTEETVDKTEETAGKSEEVADKGEEEKKDVLNTDNDEKKSDAEKDTIETEKEPIVSPEPEKPIEPEFTFADISETRYADIDMNVRSLPNLSGDVVGKLAQNDEVKVTGKCNETGWYRIEYKGNEAYASNDHLKTEKVVVAPVVTSPTTGTSTEAPNEGIAYVLNTNTKKFHKPKCSSVGDIKASNRKDVTDSRDDIIAKGYVACKKCKP